MSLRKEDLESFEAVCNDPQLSRCVKTLEYDAVGFSTELTKDEYMEGLWTQILPMTITNNSENEPRSTVLIAKSTSSWRSSGML